MPPIRRSNRVPKPRDYLDPSPPRRRQPAFTIYTEPPEDPSTQLPYQDLDSGSDLGFGSDLGSGSDLGFGSDLGSELSDEGLGSEPDEGLGSEPDEGLGSEPDEDLGSEPDEDLDSEPDEDLSEHLSRQLHESLVAQLPKDPLYQPLFPPKDRAGRPQNLPEDPTPLKLFQLFFSVKEIENIVKHTNL